jgi:hypothetical protein
LHNQKNHSQPKIKTKQQLSPPEMLLFLLNSEFFINLAKSCSFVPHMPKTWPVVALVVLLQRFRKATIV